MKCSLKLSFHYISSIMQAILFFFILISCGGNTKFFGKTSSHPTQDRSPQEETPTPPPEEADVIPEPIPTPPEEPPIEPPIIKPPTILIMDFRSGWWGGDGGFFYDLIIEELKRVFENKIEIEYHHILPSDGTGAAEDLQFVDQDWRHYVEIWILSGSEGSGDMELNDPYFVKMKEKISSSTAGLLIGAGYGSVMHANPIMESLGYKKIFSTNNPTGRFLFFPEDVTVGKRIEKNTQHLLEHELFDHVESIADQIKIKGFGDTIDVTGDYILDDDNFNILAIDAAGKNSIGVRKAGRKILLDAGLQRFYSIFNSDEKSETLRYFYNLVSYLGKP